MDSFDKKIAECYQPLFDILNGHGLTPLFSEMDEIIEASEKVKKDYNNLMSDENSKTLLNILFNDNTNK